MFLEVIFLSNTKRLLSIGDSIREIARYLGRIASFMMPESRDCRCFGVERVLPDLGFPCLSMKTQPSWTDRRLTLYTEDTCQSFMVTSESGQFICPRQEPIESLFDLLITILNLGE